MFDGKRCRKSLGLEKLAVGRNDLLPLRGTANSPPTFMVYWPRAPIFEDKRCEKSLGLGPSLRAGSLYANSIIVRVGRNAAAFLGNAAGRRRMRTAWGSVHDIMCPGPLCLRKNHVMCFWAWRNWLSVGSTSSRFAAPPILPPHL